MALLWMDSFDHYLTADIPEKGYTSSGGGITIATTGGRRSSGALRVPWPFAATTPTFTPASATAIVGYAYKIIGIAAGVNSVLVIRSGTTAQITLAIENGTGKLRVYRGTSSGTLLGTTTVALATSTYVFVELKVAIHASTGTVTLRLDEAEVLALTGQNTSESGAAAWDNVVFQNPITGGGDDSYVDDVYILDGAGAAPLNDLLGDCRVDARVPTAEGTTSAWTPLSGTDNALMVDDATPDDDTTYVSTSTVNAVDTYVVQDAPVAGATVYGVQVSIARKKSDAGTCSVAPVVRHSSVDYPGTASNPTTSYAYSVTPYGLNPGTSAAWTESDFNAAEFGVKRTA